MYVCVFLGVALKNAAFAHTINIPFSPLCEHLIPNPNCSHPKIFVKERERKERERYRERKREHPPDGLLDLK